MFSFAESITHGSSPSTIPAGNAVLLRELYKAELGTCLYFTVFSLPMAAVTNSHTFSGLKQFRFII